MKRFNNLYKYIPGLLLLIGISCDTLDQEPVNQIPVEGAIVSSRNAERALQGMYDDMQSDNYYGLRYLYYQDTYTDNLQHSGTFNTDQEVSARRINPSNLQIRNTWQSMYEVIRNANFVLYSLPNLIDATPDQLIAFEAEARFVRALVYYDLVKVFDGVPLVTSFTDRIENIDFQGRASVDEIYDFIIAELLFAEQNLVAISSTPYRAKPMAATALLARVYLQSGQNDLAAQKATEVIESGDYALQTNYRDLFTVQGNSEMVLELSFTNVDGDQSLLAISSDPATGGQKFYLRPAFFNLFAESAEEGDTRFAASVLQEDRLRVFKYFRSATNDDHVPLIRLAEMYLIRAEANARIGGLLGLTTVSIVNDINVIRSRARLAPLLLTDIPTTEDALTEILIQRRFEFAFEGHRFSDLKRFGLAADLFLPAEAFRVVWPIPFQEMEVNNNLIQNPGY
ncbi:RagB/SusD family nutrient uptake outer membrane protein [Anditalea andensis]|uniref:RagB/SusD family nutrient uptake outer membrane protein n=1 Tax=Anditalea andensis TaxID=1048983 RepID=A0A074L0X4_9BACT|nr:RagB/SusD family nutrient uptake outer membrane protein [Anditalea andensis]KEO74814.1 hypothetical protein EL17_03810 [Anditalea andensis]